MEFDNGQFLNGDCLEIMRKMNDESIDMVITSPPYDDLREYNGSNWSFDIFKPIADELARVLRNGGVIVWNVSDATVKGSETGTSFRQALYFKDHCCLNLHDTMIWQKSTFSAVGALQTRYAPVFEYMFIFTKGKIRTFNPIKDRKNKWAGVIHHGTVRQKDGSTKSVYGKSSGKRVSEFGQIFNVWPINEEKSANKTHPAVFPIQLANDHIVSWSNKGDTVLDPFAGSGTTAIACERLNRKWICIEKDQTYYREACFRVAAEYY